MSAPLQSHEFLYSHQADAGLKDTVRGIPGKHDSFGTDFLPLGPLAADGTEPMAERVEAWLNPKNGLWKLQRLTRLPGGAFRHELVTENICFFDALHYCARYQAAAADKGAQPVAVPTRRSALTHYRAAAEAAGQAIDADGAVHPCAHGQVLTNGWFSDEALALAEKTKNEELALALPAPNFVDTLIGNALTAPATAAVDPKMVFAKQTRHENLAHQFRAVAEAGDKLMHILQYEGQSLEDKILDTVFSLGIWAAYTYLKGSPGFGFNHSIQAHKTKFLRAVQGLPECPEKPLLQEFAKAGEFTFWMERAARVYQDCCNGRRNPGTAAKGLPYIEKAGAAAGFGPLDLSRLKDEYNAGGVKPDKFANDVRRIWNFGSESLRGKLNARLIALQGGPS